MVGTKLWGGQHPEMMSSTTARYVSSRDRRLVYLNHSAGVEGPAPSSHSASAGVVSRTAAERERERESCDFETLRERDAGAARNGGNQDSCAFLNSWISSKDRSLSAESRIFVRCEAVAEDYPKARIARSPNLGRRTAWREGRGVQERVRCRVGDGGVGDRRRVYATPEQATPTSASFARRCHRRVAGEIFFFC